MFGFVLSPVVKVVAIFAAIVALLATGYYKGYSNQKVKFDAYKAEVAAKAAEQTAKTEVINNTNKKIAKEVSNEYKNNLSSVREYYDRMHLDGYSTMPGVSDTSTGTNGLPTYDVLVKQCAETTLQTVTLQEFIKSTAVNY